MRLRKKPWALPLINKYKNKIVFDEKLFFNSKIENAFDNKNKIILEIGSGKGDFICNLSKLNENVNFIGIEQLDMALAISLKKNN